MYLSLGLVALYLGIAQAAASYDEYRDADILQSGYLPNHNMDPAIITSGTFGQLWKIPFNVKEQFYAKPLTYTPLAGGPQLLFMASSQNWIRTLDAATGVLIHSRQVNTPFLQSDIGCTDIPNTIGIIGTPTIDPATDIVYFFAKTYIPNFRVAGNTGLANGVYYFYAINITTLADVFPPVLIDGTIADNAPITFIGGTILQRPSLSQIGRVVYGGFGGHCDLFNYTGVIIGVDITKAKVVTMFAMESGPLVPQTNIIDDNGGGGEAGIWMSGMGLSSDASSRLYVVTGNGNGHQNQGTPASGTSGCSTLGEAAVNLAIGPTGALTLTDYFQPYDYQNMDAGDQDFGSGGIVLLDPTVFNGTGVSKMAVTAGKNGKVYILNANNLGGYKLGSGQADNVIQTIVTSQAVFGAAGSYPLEGGYIYLTPVGKPTLAFSLTHTPNGLPQFSSAGQSKEASAGRVGVGVPTVTSLNGVPGSGIVWMMDPDAGIRAWHAIPQNGILQTIPLPAIGGANKFQRPAFGNGRVYATDSNGILYCLGAPVKLPLSCTSPISFGNVAMGQVSTQIVACTANIAISSINGATVGSSLFQVSNTSLPKGPLKAGASFSFPVSFNLTDTIIQNNNGSYGIVSPGIKTTPLSLLTTNNAPGYATIFPISLVAVEVSSSPFLAISPTTVDYGGIVISTGSQIVPQTSIITISNKGLNPLTITGYGYTVDDLDDSPSFTNSTSVNGVWDLGFGAFLATDLPAIGSQIAPNTPVSVQSSFAPNNGTQAYSSFWQVWSDGGTVNIILEGIAAPPPIANFSISDGAGGWLSATNLQMNFGRVTPGSSSSRQIRICNVGGSALEIDKSKPPNGVFHIDDPTELHESQQILVQQCAFGTVLMVANTEAYNVPDLTVNNTWTLNVNDDSFGVHVVQISGTVVSNKVGPINSTTGQTLYDYLGCYQESMNGPRLFPNEPLQPNRTGMNNDLCQQTCFSSAQYTFAGTEFGDECYCGNTPPPLAAQDQLGIYCNMACPGDPLDGCGGSQHLSVFYNPMGYVAGTDPSLYGPKIVQTVGNYNYIGCYSEGTSGRALSGKSPPAPPTGHTIESCEAGCIGYTYFGMEYANECFCGNALGAGSLNSSTTGCSMLCQGSSKEYCGGPSRLDLYLLNSSTPTSRSSTISPSSSPTSTASSTTLTSSPPAAVSTIPTSKSSAGPATPTSNGAWLYLGCFNEPPGGRALPAGSYTSSALTVESCQSFCSSNGFGISGVEYSRECWCANAIATGSTAGQTGCTMPCSGNNAELCGGPNRLNMYNLTVFAPPSTPQTVGSYTYQGCYQEANGRLLNAASYSSSNNMTTEYCIAFCSAKQFKVSGLEYASECYCAATLPTNAVTVPGTQCNMLCSGNSKEFCGAGNRLSIYGSTLSGVTKKPRDE